MAGALHKTMLYLGLSDDEQDREMASEPDSGTYNEETKAKSDYPPVETSVTPINRTPHSKDQTKGATVPGHDRAPSSQIRSVPEQEELRRITTIHPRSYNDAMSIGTAFREGTPVIMNLSDMGDADAKRLVDFSAGLIMGLHGSIERVTSKVFLLSPEHVEVSGEPAVAPDSKASFFNQS